MKKLRHIFAIAAAAFAMAVTPAEALDVGDWAEPSVFNKHIQSEGYSYAAMYNQSTILVDEGREILTRNMIAINDVGDWYLISGDKPLSTPQNPQKAEYHMVKMEGTDFQLFKPNFNSSKIPNFVDENHKSIRERRDRGENVLPRSSLLKKHLEKENTFLAFSATVKNNENRVVGMVDAVIAQIDSNRQDTFVYFTQVDGGSQLVIMGNDYKVDPNLISNATDINNIKPSLLTFTPLATQHP